MSYFTIKISRNNDIIDTIPKIYNLDSQYYDYLYLDSRHYYSHEYIGNSEIIQSNSDGNTYIDEYVNIYDRYEFSFIHNYQVGIFMSKLKLYDEITLIDENGIETKLKQFDVNIENLEASYTRITIEYLTNQYQGTSCSYSYEQ